MSQQALRQARTQARQRALAIKTNHATGTSRHPLAAFALAMAQHQQETE